MRDWRQWMAVVAGSAILAVSACGQNKDGASADANHAVSAAAEKNAAPSSHVNSRAGVFALPATPWPTPFPGPAAERKDTRPPGRLLPRYELAGMYQYINFSPGSPFQNFNNHGATGSFTYNASKWMGLTAELGGYQFSRNLFPITGSNSGVTEGFTSYLFGPRLNLRKFDHFVPFAEFLIGGASAGSEMVGGQNQSAFASAAGGGVDMVLNKNLAWRVAQLDYLMTTFSGTFLGPTARQNNFRAGTGVVLRWGIPHPPPPPNHPPVAACSVNPTSIYAGSSDSVAVHVNASDPDNDPLTYSYSATGGAVEGTGSEAR
jgi:hypothetical protein